MTAVLKRPRTGDAVEFFHGPALVLTVKENGRKLRVNAGAVRGIEWAERAEAGHWVVTRAPRGHR